MVKHLWWVGLALVSASVWAQPDGSSRPVPKVGDVAVYTINQRADKRVTEETVTVTSVDQALVKSKHVRPDRNPPEIEGILTVDLALAVSGGNGTRYEPPIAGVRFPLTVGDAWRSNYLSESATAKSKGDLEFKVVAREKVKTPAGEFDAFRIESGGWVTGVSWSGSVRVAQVQWFAPAVGRVVKSEYKDYRGGQLWTDTVSELKSFTAAP
jgi:hypothetical protein